MNMNTSYVVVKTSVAKDLVNAKLTYIQHQRQNRREAFLKREVERLNAGLFHRLFRRKDHTEEDVKADDYGWRAAARRRARAARLITERWFTDQLYGDLENLCWAVQSACRLTSSDTINLSLDDAERIQ